MSKGQKLRALVNERLTAAAEEIFELFERTIAEYEEEVHTLKQRNNTQQQLLDQVLEPRVLSPRTGGTESPTAVLFANKCRTQLSEAKKKEDLQSKKIAQLTEERDPLLKQLLEYKKNSRAGIDVCTDHNDSDFSNSSKSFKQAAPYSPTSSSLSLSSSSFSSSSSSSSSSDYQRKKVKKRNKYKEKKNQKEKKKEKIRKERNIKRAVHPHHVVKRYKKVLHHFRQGKNLRSSYKAVGVDRNTVVASAAIAEVAIVSQSKYEEILQGYRRGQKLQNFIQTCSDVLNNDPALLSVVDTFKKNGKLLPIMKRK